MKKNHNEKIEMVVLKNHEIPQIKNCVKMNILKKRAN